MFVQDKSEHSRSIEKNQNSFFSSVMEKLTGTESRKVRICLKHTIFGLFVGIIVSKMTKNHFIFTIFAQFLEMVLAKHAIK